MNRTGSEELIADYIRKELAAYGIVEFDHGQIIYEGTNNDYLIEIKVLPIGKTVRLSEN